VAAQNPFQGKPAAAKSAMQGHGLFRIFGARGLETANGWEKRGDRKLVEAYAGKEHHAHGVSLFRRANTAEILVDLIEQGQEFPLGGIQSDLPGIRLFLGHDHDVQGQANGVLMESEELAKDALDPVPDHRVADLPGNGQTKPPMLFALRSSEDEKQKAFGVVSTA
jgi:hypothetical protein